MNLKTQHLTILGRVQGVGFRYYMAYKAKQFHVTGWVRNRADGSVEALIQGDADNIEQLIIRAHRGPPKSEVQSVTPEEVITSEIFTEFDIRPTPPQ
jgi:acylphosphatase